MSDGSYRIEMFVEPVLYGFTALERDAFRVIIHQAGDFPLGEHEGNPR
ncbi:hypothetical protein Holit_03364 [Hollandina sp. SP2]